MKNPDQEQKKVKIKKEILTTVHIQDLWKWRLRKIFFRSNNEAKYWDVLKINFEAIILLQKANSNENLL